MGGRRPVPECAAPMTVEDFAEAVTRPSREASPSGGGCEVHCNPHTTLGHLSGRPLHFIAAVREAAQATELLSLCRPSVALAVSVSEALADRVSSLALRPATRGHSSQVRPSMSRH